MFHIITTKSRMATQETHPQRNRQEKHLRRQQNPIAKVFYLPFLLLPHRQNTLNVMWALSGCSGHSCRIFFVSEKRGESNMVPTLCPTHSNQRGCPCFSGPYIHSSHINANTNTFCDFCNCQNTDIQKYRFSTPPDIL